METRLRRGLVIGLLVVAVLAVLGAVLAAVLSSASTGTILVVAVIVLVLALAGELFLLVWGGEKQVEDGNWYKWEKEADAEEMLLRCTSCKQTFSVLDTGERPLETTCPHCGRKGHLKDDVKPKAKPSG